MGTKKSIAFAAPYTSTTFNNEESLNVGQNGVMTGMTVTTSGSVATIQPGSFVQNGLIATVTLPISATIPSSLVAPYSIIVTTSSPVQNLAEIITPTFAQRPEDISANSVIVADWDGFEWVPRPKLQLTELLAASRNHNLDQEFAGIQTGFDVTLSGSTLNVTPGTLIDRQGDFFTKGLSSSFSGSASDVDSLLRVDELVFRRPNDDPSRSGTLQYITGPVYNASSTVQVLHKTQAVSDTSVNLAKKVINVPSSNTSLLLYLSGTNLRLITSPDLMSSFVSPVTLATGVSYFDAVLSPSGKLEIVYTSGDNVYYEQTTVTGTITFSPLLIATHAVPTLNPKLVTVGASGNYFIHVVYEINLSPSVHQLWYVRLSDADTIETAQLLLVDLTAVVTTPSLDKDDTDSIFLLAYENATTGKVYLREYDATTATALAIPNQIGATLELETDTFVISTSTTLSASGATAAKVVRAANKETYVFWLQDKGSGNYGVAVYNRNNPSIIGHQAYIQDLVTSGENIHSYDVSLDGLNNAHFILSESIDVWKASLVLETADLLGTTTTIDTNSPSSVAINFNAKGSLVHFWSYVSGPNTTVNFAKTTAGVFTNLRGFNPIHTDLILAHYRTPDGAYAALGKVIDERQAITRLYEFINCAGASGQVSWGVTASSQLAFTSAITLNFFNRVSTYTIAAIPGGITIAANQFAYVQIPDTDSPATLTLNVATYGAGILDRHTRNTFVLFWNTGGALYSRFAPFRLTSGEIILLGDQFSVELQNWLGATSNIPTTHSYNTAQRNILNTDSHESAIGHIDTELDKFFGQLLLTPTSGFPSRLTVTGADVTMRSGVVRSESINSLLMNFTGAQLSFGGVDVGTIYASDGITVIGSFTMPVIPTGNWQWFAVSVTAGTTGSDNRTTVTIQVTPASTNGVSQSASPRASFASTGTSLGEVAVQSTGLNTINPINQTNIVQLGVGSGSGGASFPQILDEVLGSNSGTNFVLSPAPVNAASVWPRIDGIPLDSSEWTLSGGNTIVLGTALVFGQSISAFWIANNTSGVAGMQGVPIGVIDGVNATFTLPFQPVNKNSMLVRLGGGIADTSEWDLIQGAVTDQIVFHAGSIPALHQTIYVFAIIAIGGVSNVGSTGSRFVVYGSLALPFIVTPASGLTATGDDRQQYFLQGLVSGGAQTVTANPQISAGPFVGAEMKLKGTSATDYLIFTDGNGLKLNGPISLTDQNSINLSWDGVAWSEDARRV